MRIAFFTLDGLVSSAASQRFLEANSDKVALVVLSPAFRREAGGMLGQSWRHLKRSGIPFSLFLACNFSLPRLMAHVLPHGRTIAGCCERLGIPLEYAPDINATAFRHRLAAAGVDLVVISFFDQILGVELLSVPRLGVINVHISPLPDHRGPMPVIHGCLDTPPRLGVSVHLVEAGIDTGPVLAQCDYVAPEDASVLTLMRQLQDMGLDMARAIIDNFSSELQSVEQTEGSYETFPTRAQIHRLHRTGRRLFDLRDLRAALCTPANP